MIRIRAILLSLAALLVLMGSSYAIGVHKGSSYCVVQAGGDPPVPASDLLCSKRMMPAEPQLKAHRLIEVPRATEAQWRLGLSDELIPEGRGPWTELKPPRVA